MDLSFLGIRAIRLPSAPDPRAEMVITQHPLQRVLAFTGHSLNELSNPIIYNKVMGYYRLAGEIERACEVVDLERWWNQPARL